MTRKINQTGLDHIKQWEGLRLNAYRDVAGVWTIGYGHTAAAGEPKPKAGMKMSEKEAETILIQDLTQYEQTVENAVTVTLNDHQFATLVSFTYNVGIGAFRRSTLLKKLNKGDYDAVPSELMKWVNAGGRKIKGLVNRRRAEGALWIKGDFVSSNYITPETDQSHVVLKPEVVAPLLGAASGLTGFATGHGPFQWALAGVMVIGACVGVFHFVKRMKNATQ
ncbi:lysozyme [Bartonella tamiae]|uniref:Lysozyme n=1 Tax=Bartonella tamiae Th239 TaxID=1094558 RepID=J1K2I6_9HYPH|nr:lysozyme [Bartonella tamiae]EJF91697.1 hypothetical protein ME5_00076 [Bartonella tamiae Th239]